jgi:DNA invertase Pin-like site-specific DNA recombinase
MSPKQTPKLPVEVYVRVSRVGSRDVEAEGGTAAEQEKRCRAQAAADGLEVGEVFVDLDESGGKESRPAFDKMMARIQSGASGGVVTLNLRRFGRRRSVVEDILGIEEQGAVFISCEEKIDTSTPSGRFMLTVFAAIATMELEERREGWSRARGNAVERGIHVTSTLPAGYDRDPETKGLVPNADAPAIREAFELRAKGAGWGAVAAFLNERGVRTSHRGRPRKVGEGINDGRWSAKSAFRLTENRVYLGEARSGDFVRGNAHEAIVSKRLWARVQGRRQEPGSFSNPDRERSLLAGLVKCAACGNAMIKDSTRRLDEKGVMRVYPFFRCKNVAVCPSRATIGVERLESFIEDNILGFFQDTGVGLTFLSPAFRPAGDDQALVDALLEAEDELTLYAQLTSAVDIGAEAFRAGLDARKARVEEARRLVADAAPAAWPPEEWSELGAIVGDVIKPLPDGKVQFSGEALVHWWGTLTGDQKRRFLSMLFDGIEVRPGRGPVRERVRLMPKARGGMA